MTNINLSRRQLELCEKFAQLGSHVDEELIGEVLDRLLCDIPEELRTQQEFMRFLGSFRRVWSAAAIILHFGLGEGGVRHDINQVARRLEISASTVRELLQLDYLRPAANFALTEYKLRGQRDREDDLDQLEIPVRHLNALRRGGVRRISELAALDVAGLRDVLVQGRARSKGAVDAILLALKEREERHL